MLKPLDRHRRDSTLFQFTTRSLRDSIDPGHLLIQVNDQFVFGKLVAPLEEWYCPVRTRCHQLLPLPAVQGPPPRSSGVLGVD